MKKENPFYNLNNNNYEHINPFVNSYNQIPFPNNNINNNQQHQQFPQIPQQMPQIQQPMQQIYQPMQQIQQPTQLMPQPTQQIPQQMQQIPQQNTENNNNKRPNKYLLINKIRDPIIIDFHAHPI